MAVFILKYRDEIYELTLCIVVVLPLLPHRHTTGSNNWIKVNAVCNNCYVLHRFNNNCELDMGLNCELDEGLNYVMDMKLSCELDKGLNCELDKRFSCVLDNGLNCELDKGLNCNTIFQICNTKFSDYSAY